MCPSRVSFLYGLMLLVGCGGAQTTVVRNASRASRTAVQDQVADGAAEVESTAEMCDKYPARGFPASGLVRVGNFRCREPNVDGGCGQAMAGASVSCECIYGVKRADGFCVVRHQVLMRGVHVGGGASAVADGGGGSWGVFEDPVLELQDCAVVKAGGLLKVCGVSVTCE